MRRMRVTHSSELTLPVKALFPLLWVGVWALVIVTAFRDPGSLVWNGVPGGAPPGAEWMIVAVGGAGSAFVLSLCGGLARVRTVGRELVLSGFRDEARVPAEQVERVTLWWWARPGIVTIVLRDPTPFGRHVSFVPPMSPLHWLGLGWLDDTPVSELRRWVRESRADLRNPLPGALAEVQDADGRGSGLRRGAHPANQRRSAP